MVPVLIQTPPIMLRRSTIPTRRSSLAAAIAAFCPPGPEPRTSTSKSRTHPVWQDSSLDAHADQQGTEPGRAGPAVAALPGGPVAAHRAGADGRPPGAVRA